tara:strand:- start:4431 stop:4604 length:174 start_codon:yes stop_codon:yes gene_type:complete
MKPTDASIGRFRSAWKKEYGEDLPKELAREYAEDLLELGKIVYRNRIITRGRAPPSA